MQDDQRGALAEAQVCVRSVAPCKKSSTSMDSPQHIHGMQLYSQRSLISQSLAVGASLGDTSQHEEPSFLPSAFDTVGPVLLQQCVSKSSLEIQLHKEKLYTPQRQMPCGNLFWLPCWNSTQMYLNVPEHNLLPTTGYYTLKGMNLCVCAIMHMTFQAMSCSCL